MSRVIHTCASALIRFPPRDSARYSRRFPEKILLCESRHVQMVHQACELRRASRGPVMGMPNAPWSSRPSRSPSPTTALRLAASHMTGATRRALEAARTLHECAGHPLMAEAVLGWGRQTVALGLAERRPGLMWLGAPSAFRG